MNEILWIIGITAAVAFLFGVGLGRRVITRPQPIVIYTPPTPEVDSGGGIFGMLLAILIIVGVLAWAVYA